MRILLDTHILLWWLADDPALPQAAAAAIAEAGTQVVVSAATAWEIAIKKAAGRLDAPDDLPVALAATSSTPYRSRSNMRWSQDPCRPITRTPSTEC